jgi:hypothetical protein
MEELQRDGGRQDSIRLVEQNVANVWHITRKYWADVRHRYGQSK